MSRRPPAAVTVAAALSGSADEVEARFYDALQRGDLEQVMAVWADDDEILCVHPSGARVVGATAIRESFTALFANGAVNARPEQVRRLVMPDMELHHLVERVEVQTVQGPRTAWVLASNLYVRSSLGWRLAAHHASPGQAQPPAGSTELPTVLH